MTKSSEVTVGREPSTGIPDDSSLSGKHPLSDEQPLHIDPLAEKKAVRLMDWTVLPVVTMFYLLAFLDRANIGNARVAGLQQSLKLTDHQYQVAVTVLYVPYIVVELPSNLLLRKIGPRLLMPTLLTIWGIVATLQGLVNSYGGLVAVRAILGLVEGPTFPAIVLYLSRIYPRKELALRIALFFSAASLSGAFSGLLAAAIQNLDGVGGKASWSWIFILEGLFSVLMGIVAFFVLPSTPRDSKFLTDDQKDIIERRLEKDRPVNTQDQFTFLEVFRSLTSPHVIMICVIFFCIGTTLYGLALFLPSIIKQLGFSPVKSQLLSVGPFAAAFFMTLVSAYASDHYGARGIPTALISLLAVAGFALFLKTDHKFVAYGSLYLTVPGVYATAPMISAWMANNSEPHYRRATSIALGSIATTAGGILSTWRFPTNEGPRFTKTTILDLIFSVFVVVGPLVNILVLSYMNKYKRKNRDKILAPYADEKTPGGGGRAWIELGDRHPDFVYVY